MGKTNNTLEDKFTLKSKLELKEFGANATIQNVSNEHGPAYISCYHPHTECTDREFNITNYPLCPHNSCKKRKD